MIETPFWSKRRKLIAYGAWVVGTALLMHVVPIALAEGLFILLFGAPVALHRRPVHVVSLGFMAVIIASFFLWIDPLAELLAPLSDQLPRRGWLDFRPMMVVRSAATGLVGAMLLLITTRSWRVMASAVGATLLSATGIWFEPDYLVNLVVHFWYLWIGLTLWIWMARSPQYRPGQCRRCGYDLAGLAAAVCPECGAARTIQSQIARNSDGVAPADL
ncbi:MAG: hypothetical protein H7Y88_06445 [Phycisphaerales bacterium]|nr:hypothetical protein [Phycisphaerales bacterium]